MVFWGREGLEDPKMMLINLEISFADVVKITYLIQPYTLTLRINTMERHQRELFWKPRISQSKIKNNNLIILKLVKEKLFRSIPLRNSK